MGVAHSERDEPGENLDQSDRFEAVFRAENRRILAFALRRVDNAQDAADVVAETFLVAWRRIDDIPDGDERRLWLYGVARNVLANHRRSAARRDRLAARLNFHIADVVPDSADVETDLTIRDAIGRLGEADREILILSAWEELTPAEIAAVLRLSKVNVRTRLHRARRRLRTALGQTDDDLERPVAAEPKPSLSATFQEAE